MFLGLKIHCNGTKRTLHLSQSNYVKNILSIFKMKLCNPALTPANPHVCLESSKLKFEATLYERKRYQSAVGSLMYAMLRSRPDIDYAVSRVSQYSINSDPTHWTAVKQIFRYLAGIPNRWLCYGNFGSGRGFTDADWGSGEDRRSICGYTFLLNGPSISWVSSIQSTVALSYTEAKYMALTQAVKKSIWLQGLLSDLGVKRHVEEMQNIKVDNQDAIALAGYSEFHARTKHINIQFHFVQEHLEKRTITHIYCPTAEMTADIFTQGSPHSSFTKYNIGLCLLAHSAFLLDTGTNDNLYDDVGSNGSTGEGWYY